MFIASIITRRGPPLMRVKMLTMASQICLPSSWSVVGMRARRQTGQIATTITNAAAGRGKSETAVTGAVKSLTTEAAGIAATGKKAIGENSGTAAMNGSGSGVRCTRESKAGAA